MTDKQIGEAIDRAVHSIMHVDAAPGLTRRVIARLDEPARRSWVTVPRLAIAATAAALALLVVASIQFKSEAPSHDVVARNPKPTNPIVQPDRAPVPPSEPAHVHDENRPTLDRRATRRIEAAAVPAPIATTVALAPLTSIVPIHVAGVTSDPIAVEEIAIEPIRITPLQIEPPPATPR